MDKEDVVFIDNGILPSHEENRILPFAATCLDLEGMMLNEIDQTEANTLFSLTCET